MQSAMQLHQKAVEDFGHLVHQIEPDQWDSPTPCTDWNVRDLVNHVAVEMLWAPPLLHGGGLADIAPGLEGDRLGNDPAGAWDMAAADDLAAFGEHGAMQRQVELSRGPTPASTYLGELTDDLTVHAWDLARGLGVGDTLDAQLVQAAYEHLEPVADSLASTGLFAERIDVSDDADMQTKLLAAVGRRR
jgi:uncharacterized protein (TIGR03086 family)